MEVTLIGASWDVVAVFCVRRLFFIRCAFLVMIVGTFPQPIEASGAQKRPPPSEDPRCPGRPARNCAKPRPWHVDPGAP
eukprot:scaffold15502_cov37-Phaeocystis_antarctica.AAC.3